VYPTLVEKVVAKLRQEYSEVLIFEGPSLDERWTFFIILRPFTLREFEYYTATNRRDREAAKEFAVNNCVLDVFNGKSHRFVPLKELPLGLYDDALQVILDNSGFSPEELKASLSQYRAASSATQLQAQAFICRAFPGMSPRQIEQMTATDLVRYIALAEIVYASKGEEDPHFHIMLEGDVVTQEQEKSKTLQGIAREARQNDRIMGTGSRRINVGKENSDQRAMGG